MQRNVRPVPRPTEPRPGPSSRRTESRRSLDDASEIAPSIDEPIARWLQRSWGVELG